MNANYNGNNSFGEFLSALRKSRGFSNTSEYLRRYQLSISSVHYRQLESGNRNISIEAAKLLCKELQAEPKSLYFSLLKDWLPSEVMDFLVPLSQSHKDAEFSYRQSVMRALDSQVLFPDEECCNYLEKNFELMPVLWFIYSVQKASMDDIEQLSTQHSILMPPQTIVDRFIQLGLVKSVEPKTSECIQRVRPIISFPHNRLSKKILQYETKQFQDIFDQPDIASRKDSLMFYSLMSVSASARQIVFKRIQEFVRDVRNLAEETFLSNVDVAEPVFYSIVFAPRSQYYVGTPANHSGED